MSRIALGRRQFGSTLRRHFGTGQGLSRRSHHAKSHQQRATGTVPRVMPSAFVVPVSALLTAPGSRRAVGVDVPIEWGFELAAVGPQLHAELVLENASGVLVVRGPAETTLGLTCHRCLSEWSESLRVDVTEALGFEDDDDGYALDGDTADLEPVLRDALLLDVPLRPLCRDACLGLCGTCGADLNTDSCPGHDEEGTSPFAELRDLLEP